MRDLRTWLFVLCVAIIGGAAGPASAQDTAEARALDALLSRAGELGASGRHAEAYRVLEAGEDAYIGMVAYDYALGRAALQAGMPDRATLAFARVLALRPDHAGAAIDLARSYLALGNREQARAVLDGLLELGPPPHVRLQLEAMRAQASAPAGLPAFVRGYVAAGIGRDTNVNFALSQSRVFVPLFGVEVELAAANRARPDRYASIGGGVEFQRPLGGSLALVGGADVLERRNAHESAYDLGSLSGRLGLAFRLGGLTARAQAQHARTFMDHRGIREVDAATFDLRPEPSDALQWMAYAQSGRYRHPPETLRVFDADFGGAGALLAYPVVDGLSLVGGVSAGGETDRGGNPGGDRRLRGARAGFEARLAPRLSLLVLGTRQTTAYERADGAFRAVRRDRRSDAEVALQYQLDRQWLLRAALVSTTQDSTVPIYSFRRHEFGLTARWSFE